MDGLPLYNFIIIVILLLMSGFFSMSEGALFSLGRHQREKFKKEGTKSSSLIENLLKNPHNLIITILLADEVINVAYASLVASTVRAMVNIPSEELITVICIAISSPSLLLLGEIGPKTLGVKYPRLIASAISYPLNLFHNLIAPLRWIILILSIGFTKLFQGGAESNAKAGFDSDEVKALVGLGSEGGVVTEIEKNLVESLFKLEDVPVYKIMTSNIDCFSIPVGASPKDAVPEVKKRGFSRVPVYNGDRDNIAGILYVKDLLSAEAAEKPTVESLIKPAYFIPRTKRAFDLLREFRQKRIHIAVVVDEYGRFDGIVSMEDLLEELFGDIEDERRVESGSSTRSEGGAIFIPGSMKIEEFNDEILFTVLRRGGLDSLGDDMDKSIIPPEDDHETVAGFVFDLFGRFPNEGESVNYGSLAFTIAKLTGRRIAEIKVERAQGDDA